MRALCALALLCFATAAAAEENAIVGTSVNTQWDSELDTPPGTQVDIVYCNHTVLKRDGSFQVDQCRDICVHIAGTCLAAERTMPKDIEIEGIPVTAECFSSAAEEYDKSCIFAMSKDVNTGLRIASGIVPIKETGVKTVSVSNMTSPIVFVQLITDSGEHLPPKARVAVNVVNKTNFNLSIKGVPASSDTTSGSELFVQWIAIDESDLLKGFRHYHVDLQKYKITSKERHRHGIDLTNAQGWSENIAMFVQELSTNVEVTAALITTENSITVNIQPTYLSEEIGKEGSSVSAEVAVLLVDMNHFKNGAKVMFGNLPISFPAWRRSKEGVQLEMAKPEQGLIFFTPHYNRITSAIPVESCWFDYVASEHGSFFCHLEPESLITLPHIDTPNFALMLVGNATDAKEDDIDKFRYKNCYDAYSTKLSAQKERQKPWKETEDMECKRSCLAQYHLCRGRASCLKAYMNVACEIDGYVYKSQEHKVVENPPTFVDLIHVLSYELKGAVCKGLLDAAKIDELKKHKYQWERHAEELCRAKEGEGKQDDVLVVIDGHLSAKFCENINDRDEVEWTPLTSMWDKLVVNGKAKTVEEIFENRTVFGLCHKDGIIHMNQYFDHLKEEPELPEEDVSVDCIESEWAEWGQCSAECIPDDGVVIRKRVRYVLQKPSGNGRKCVIEETKPCVEGEIPVCSKICLLTEWTDWSRCVKYKQHRERYVKSYTVHCDTAEKVEVRDCKPGGDDEFTLGEGEDDEEEEEDEDEGEEDDDEGEEDDDGEEDEDEDYMRDDGRKGADYETGETLHGKENRNQPRYLPQSSALRQPRRMLHTSGVSGRTEPRGYRRTQVKRNRDGDPGDGGEIGHRQDSPTLEVEDETMDSDDSDETDDLSFSSGGRLLQSGPHSPSNIQLTSRVDERGAHSEKARRRKAQGGKSHSKQRTADETSLLEFQEDQENRNCHLWSEWSGCSSVCNDDVGRQYKVSTRCDAHSTYELSDKIDKRLCEHQEDCGLKAPLVCKQVRSLYFSEADDVICQEECVRLLQSCRETKERNHLLCLAKLRTVSAEDASFFHRCVLPDEQEETLKLLHTLFQNRCFISRASYSQEEGSWVNKETRSCHCSIPGSVPCTAKELHYTRNDVYRDLIDSGFCPSLNYKQAFFNVWKQNALPDSLTYVSLADNQRLHCPLGVDDETFTYTQFAEGELENYCRHGPVYAAMKAMTERPVRQYAHKYDCSTVVSTSSTMTDFECGALCRTVRAKCLTNHKKYLKCIKDRLTDFRYEADIFKEYGCKLPPTLDSTFDEEYYRAFIGTMETEQADKMPCIILTQNAILHCEAEELLNNPDTLVACMARHMGEAEPTTPAGPPTLFEATMASVERFKQNCKFSPSRKAGSGYVMCRFPTETDGYENWSQWSECTANCNDFENVATRYRTRRMAAAAKNTFFRLREGTLQFELCLHLPGCEKGRWIDSFSEEDGIHLVDYEAYSEHHNENNVNWLEQTYLQYPELRNTSSESASCQIYKSSKIFSSKGTICGCPHGHKPCSFATAMADPMWMVGMQNFCQKRPLASIGFEGTIRDYRYYCNIGMLFMQTEYSGPLACEYFDNEEYVACQASDTKPITLRSKQFTLMGVCLGVVFCTYAVILYLIKNRRKRNSAEKKSD
ncbi:hypothetical protein, conserved [Babesia bigemina]|uniref:Uncharacterized protein n=1 Tax=Babesia bigemina TaxID=5866 RepID=A0A061D1P4_BABBI|nr:hypothetical protein, conserved [Babesia bigemina]CDR94052.1 hypothetical protein, conserved [Babesia bigemina]|eukprot:XP_012766238.1 hypothetical protein, conserved [Babesia bigemina]